MGFFKVLTTGLLRVELAPEEYQLYSEGCGQGGREEGGGRDRCQATGTAVRRCGGDIAETLSDKH